LSIRWLTPAERKLAESVFHNAVDYDQVRLANNKFFPFQPRGTVMAPRGTIHFHPKGPLFCEDFCGAEVGLSDQGLFIHEMTHIWQHQRGLNLLLRRHLFCRYSYSIKPGWPLLRYGIEQQAEIVRHFFLIREGLHIAGAPKLDVYRGILPFNQK
jgi:hypothetical protein